MKQVVDKELTKGKISYTTILNDTLIQNYYDTLYDNMTINELDNDFRLNLNTLSKHFAKLNASEKKVFVEIFSDIIGHYLEKKVEKQLEVIFEKTLKIQ